MKVAIGTYVVRYFPPGNGGNLHGKSPPCFFKGKFDRLQPSMFRVIYI